MSYELGQGVHLYDEPYGPNKYYAFLLIENDKIELNNPKPIFEDMKNIHESKTDHYTVSTLALISEAQKAL